MPTAAELKNAVELGGWTQTAADINAGIKVRTRYCEALEKIAAADHCARMSFHAGECPSCIARAALGERDRVLTPKEVEFVRNHL